MRADVVFGDALISAQVLQTNQGERMAAVLSPGVVEPAYHEVASFDAVSAHHQPSPHLLQKSPHYSPSAADTSARYIEPAHQAILEAVVATSLIPELLARYRVVNNAAGNLLDKQYAKPGLLILPAAPAVSALAMQLANLLIADEAEAAFALIDSQSALATSPAGLYASLFEPAARALGDLWRADACSEFDVTLGQSRMQMAVRRIKLAAPVLHKPVGHSVLVAVQPGELHALGAVLDAEVLWHAGWDTHCESPANNAALCEYVGEHCVDVLDLSLSVLLRRDEQLGRMAETIAQTRSASLNPALVIVVGGRVFNENNQAAAQVGADLACTTVWQIDAMLSAHCA
jgi:methanogenic corrinoid protein MtbC1